MPLNPMTDELNDARAATGSVVTSRETALDEVVASRSVARLPWAIAAVYCATLTVLLLTPEISPFSDDLGPAPEADDLIPAFIEHLGAYGILSALLVWASGMSSRWGAGRWVSLAMLHGALTEGLQRFVPTRYPDWNDVLADCLGAAIGWIVVAAAIRLRGASAG